MRPGIGAVIIGLLGSAVAPLGAAEFGTVFVVPGKPGVPVVINGWDASYSVVEGEFGLDRPGQVNPVIVSGPRMLPAPLHFGPYYPRDGRKPGYGRYEIEPPANRRLPPPAQSYHRYWSSHSEPLPATLNPPAAPPEVEVNVNRDDANRDNKDMNNGGNGNGAGGNDRDLRRHERDLRRHERDRRRRVSRHHRRHGHH